MPRYIDAETVIKRLDEIQPFAGNKAANAAINIAKDIIRNAPTVSSSEVRGVVHCGECSHAERRMPIGPKTEIFCQLLSAGVRDADFCSFGKRGAKMEATDDA